MPPIFTASTTICNFQGGSFGMSWQKEAAQAGWALEDLLAAMAAWCHAG